MEALEEGVVEREAAAAAISAELGPVAFQGYKYSTGIFISFAILISDRTLVELSQPGRQSTITLPQHASTARLGKIDSRSPSLSEDRHLRRWDACD